MANLEHDYNIYADLAQGAYTGRPTQFPYDKNKWNEGQLDSHKKNESVKFNFSNAKDAHGNSIDSVYLQPESLALTLFLVKESNL